VLNIRKAQLLAVLETNVSSSLGNIGVIVFITAIISYLSGTALIYFWMAYMLFFTAIRYWVTQNLHDIILKGGYKPFYENIMVVIVYMMAAGWGALSIVFIEQDQPEVNVFILITLTGVVVTSMSALIYIRKLYFGFVLISVVPVLFVLLWMDGSAYKIFALQVFLYVLYVVKNGSLFNKKIEDNLKLIDNNEKLIEDLKEQKHRAEEVSELKSQFLANMSHEIRTPMNGIVGFLQILQSQETNKQKIKYLDTISKSTEDLMQIIDGVLDLSKLEKNQLMLNKQKFNPLHVVKQSIDLFSENAAKNAIEIILEPIGDIPELITSDSLRLKQVINNLLSNALKFSPKNSPIKVQVEYLVNEKQLKFDVIDYGIGIPADKIDQVFESFTQVDGSNTRQYGGTGLGLSICSHLVDLMGGKIKVDSALGVGSRFSFTIDAPAKIESNDEGYQSQAQQEFDVLIVEDNLINQKLLIEILTQLNLSFDIANNGLEALNAFKTNRYQAILMDENMPDMSGSKATEEIRILEQKQNLHRTPIIAVTANVMSGDKERFLQAGMDEYIPKPVSLDNLENILNRYLKKHS